MRFIKLTKENAHAYVGNYIVFTSRGQKHTKQLKRVSDTGKRIYINHPDLQNSLEIVKRVVYVILD